MPKPTKDLVAIIRANPGCVAMIDNDCWSLYKVSPQSLNEPDDDASEAEMDAYHKLDADNELASSDDRFHPLPDGGGYGSGCCYGGDILQALAIIVGVTIESV